MTNSLMMNYVSFVCFFLTAPFPDEVRTKVFFLSFVFRVREWGAHHNRRAVQSFEYEIQRAASK